MKTLLDITSASGDKVYYTLDGGIPTEEAELFTGELSNENISGEPNNLSEIQTTPNASLIDYKEWESPQDLIDKATVLRSALFKDGVRTSNLH